MSKLCLNCNRTVPEERDFCNQCESNLDKMVDRREVESKFTNKMEMTNNVNPFFSNSSATGNIENSDRDSVSSQVEKTKGGGNSFWTVLLTLIAIMTAMIVIFI